MEKYIFFIFICIILLYIIFKIFLPSETKVDTFLNILSTGEKSKQHIIYNFSTSWCGHCQNFQPTWDKFSKDINNSDNIQALDIKCDKSENKELCDKYSDIIPGYPCIIMVKDNIVSNYKGQRTIEGLQAFVDSSLTKSSNIPNNKIMIYNFNTKWCSYSIKFQPIWDNFVNSLSSDELKLIDAIDVKCDNKTNEILCKKFNIQGYPSVIIVKNDKFIDYTGPRTVDSLRNALDLQKVVI